MATGITSKNKKTKAKVPVYLGYEGKKDRKDILGLPSLSFDYVTNINGKSENNKFFFGDNLEVLLYLLHSGYKGRINLIYIDPPFATASDFVNRKQKRAYHDSLVGGEYIEFLRERLILMRELLSEKGSIYLHLDNKMAFNMKVIMDEIFGESNFRAFITRKKCSTKNYTKKTYGNISDYLMFYSKTSNYTWNRPYDPWDFNRMIEQYPYVDEKTGHRYKKVPVHAPGTRNGETGKEWHGMMPPAGKHWQYTPSKLDEMDAAGEIYWSPTGNPRRKVFCDPEKGVPIQDIWLNYRDSVNQADKTTGYPTEKNASMLKMIVEASSNKGDLVLDCFAGSGTTLDAAFETGRYWIGADNSIESLKAIMKRFTDGLDIYGDYVNKQSSKQQKLDRKEKCFFSVYSLPEQKKDVASVCKTESKKNDEGLG